MKTGKLAVTHADTTIRGRGSIVAGPWSRTNCVRDQFAHVDCSRLRTVCGQFAFAAAARSRMIEAIACAGLRAVCECACWRGLSADTDCLWPRTIRFRVPCGDCSSLRISRVCGCGQFILCGSVEHLSRLTRGLKPLRNQGVTRALS